MNLDRVEKYLEGHVKNTTFISGFISATMFGPPMSKDQVPTYRMAVRLVPQAVRFFKITHDENLSFEETSTRSQDVRVTSALVLRLILAASTKKIDIKGLLNNYPSQICRRSQKIGGDDFSQLSISNCDGCLRVHSAGRSPCNR